MVPIGPPSDHNYPARDPGALASVRLSPVLALEIPLPWRPAEDRRGPPRVDPADERGKSAVASTARRLNLGILQRTSVGVDNAIARKHQCCLAKKTGGWAQYGAVHLIYCAVQHI